jgi:hypothetical protein
MNLINIDYKIRYSFGEMIDKISEDSTLSFISNGKLYFKKGETLKTCDFTEDLTSGAPYGEEVKITSELIKQSFYQTDIYISEIITQIKIEEVKENLLQEKPIMFTVGNNTWVIELEDDVVYLDYSEIPHATDDNYMELFTIDILEGLINSMWHVIERDETKRVLH